MRAPVLFLILAGCPPWITRQQHDENTTPEPQVQFGPLRTDLVADAECVAQGAGTAWQVGELTVADGSAQGAEQVIVLAHPDWMVDGAPAVDCFHQFASDGPATGDFDAEGLAVVLTATWQGEASTCDPARFFASAAITRSWRAQGGSLYGGDASVGEADFDGTTLTFAAGPTCIWPHAE